MFIYNDDDLIIGTPREAEYQRFFSEAWMLAAAENKRLGIPIVYVKSGNVVKEYADGKTEILAKAVPGIVYNGEPVIKFPAALPNGLWG
ncbi:MAG: hypothetical protein LBI42_00845 [Chitinispirillales bacterium]|jgi:hypothetical protein|nr:hypothetical protein [Chitinispirillales bacterium]